VFGEIFEAAPIALQSLLSNLPWLLAGIGVGVTIGILPGIGGIVGMSVLIPFIFGADPSAGIPLLIGMTAIVHTADTFPSVLLGIPGSAGSQATIMDGYPLAKKGQAARALSAAFTASMIGGLIGAAVLFLVLPIGREILLIFGSPERFMLALLGVSMVGVLAGRRPARGALMGFAGLLLGAVGIAPGGNEFRYIFGVFYLLDGFNLALLALGIFALPEIIDLLAKQTSIAARRKAIGGGWLRGIRDALSSWFLILRSSILGTIVGFIPGLGGSVVDWLSYGIAKTTLRKTENFGKGDVRGVIAPESSNNAKEGGALIPTIFFGIPGSPTTAILLGGLFILNIQPGPNLFTNLDGLAIVLLIVWSLAAANVFGTGLTTMVAPIAARVATVSIARLAPFLLIIMVIGAYQATRSWGDIITFFVIGLIAWFLRKARFPLVPVLIGFVLSLTIETQLSQAIQLFGTSWLTRPGVITIAIAIVILAALAIRLQRAEGATSGKI